jgi:hypothetical protein
MSDLKVMPSPAEKPWLRATKYKEKYDIGTTTFWKWRKEGLVETYQVDGILYVRDELPRPKS